MTPQQKLYIRSNVHYALVGCDSKESKAQLEGFKGFALADTKHYGRKRKMTVEIDGRFYCRDTDPVHVTPTMAHKRQYVPITPEAYETAGWRRAINKLESHQRAWIVRCYGYNMGLDHYMQVCEFVWGRLHQELAGKRVSQKMVERLVRLVELAVENTEERCRYSESPLAYEPIDAAKEIGVALDNWSKNYKKYWRMLHRISEELDAEALKSILVKCDL